VKACFVFLLGSTALPLTCKMDTSTAKARFDGGGILRIEEKGGTQC
jgi:hypothetical protein